MAVNLYIQTFTPNSGDTILLAQSEADILVVIDTAGTLANLSIPTPDNPINGQLFGVASRSNITNLALTTSSIPIIGTTNTLTGGVGNWWIYVMGIGKWIRYIYTEDPTTLQSTLASKQPVITPGSLPPTMLSNSALHSINGINTGDAYDEITAMRTLGSLILAQTVGISLLGANTSTPLVDNQIKYTAVHLVRASNITGINVYVRVLGSYTADNNNRIGLYSCNLNTGLLTLVASSANNGTLWTSAANARQVIPFSSVYSATTGIYVVALLYNNSAQVTAPALASGTVLNNLAQASAALGLTNSVKLYGTSIGNDLPATINMSAITGSAIPSWVALYL